MDIWHLGISFFVLVAICSLAIICYMEKIMAISASLAVALVAWLIVSLLMLDSTQVNTYTISDLPDCKVIEIYRAERSLGIRYDVNIPTRTIICDN